MSTIQKNGALSLVEVVVAVGIFGFVAVVVVGLLGPLARSVSLVAEVDDASRLSSVLQAGLQAEVKRTNWNTFAGYLNGSTTLYANREGTRIGPGDVVGIWDADESGSVDDTEHGQKFFAITLHRDTILSPGAKDEEAGYLAFSVRIAWPAYRPDGTKVAGDGEKQQSTMIIPASVVR